MRSRIGAFRHFDARMLGGAATEGCQRPSRHALSNGTNYRRNGSEPDRPWEPLRKELFCDAEILDGAGDIAERRIEPRGIRNVEQFV